MAARADRATAELLDQSVHELQRTSELQALLLEERNWYGAVQGIAELGIDPALVTQLTGIDVEEEFSVTSQRVDDIVEEKGWAWAEEDLEVARNDDAAPLDRVVQRYAELEHLVSLESDSQMDEIARLAGVVDQHLRLSNRIRLLEASNQVRRAHTALFSHYFGAQFGEGTSRSGELSSLAGARLIYRNNLATIDRLAVPSSSLDATKTMVDDSDHSAQFHDTIDELLASELGESGPEPTIAAVLSDLERVSATFNAWTVSETVHFDMVYAASRDVHAASASVRADAVSRDRRALAGLAGLVVISLLVGLVVARRIVIPVKQLAHAAATLGDGDDEVALPGRIAPLEIQEVAEALDSARNHFRLAERQALALAEGSLDHPSLAETSPGSLGASLQSAVQTLAASMQEREEFRRRVTYEASHDGLTQLINRRASIDVLQRGLARTARTDGYLAAISIDLERFKEINDVHGHGGGDEVLKTAARRLASAVRDGDTVARLGGDEFLVTAEPVADEREATALARRILERLNQPLHLDDQVLTLGVSIGVAISRPGAYNAVELLRDADLAVYRAKELGHNRIVVCDDVLRTESFERIDLEQAIGTALQEGQFILHYQPIVSPGSSQVVGFEALVRWDRPGHGMVPPDDFIGFAERSDLIISIDQWVLTNVIRQIRRWNAEGRFADLPISVNISGRHLTSPGFLAHVIEPLEDYGVDPGRVIIEVTESALMDDLAHAAERLERLRALGIRIAIDDFGTGYTSLSHLRQLPIDILKIDRSFTNDRSSSSLVKLIIDTGHLLGASITAEGIEQSDQADWLGQMGADHLQGYLYGRPRPADDVKNVAANTPIA